MSIQIHRITKIVLDDHVLTFKTEDEEKIIEALLQKRQSFIPIIVPNHDERIVTKDQ